MKDRRVTSGKRRHGGIKKRESAHQDTLDELKEQILPYIPISVERAVSLDKLQKTLRVGRLLTHVILLKMGVKSVRGPVGMLYYR